MKHILLMITILLVSSIAFAQEKCIEVVADPVLICYEVPECPQVPVPPTYKASWKAAEARCKRDGKRQPTIAELEKMDHDGIYWSGEKAPSSGAWAYDFNRQAKARKAMSRGYGVLCVELGE